VTAVTFRAPFLSEKRIFDAAARLKKSVYATRAPSSTP
jgi:hypothetical protein